MDPIRAYLQRKNALFSFSKNAVRVGQVEGNGVKVYKPFSSLVSKAAAVSAGAPFFAQRQVGGARISLRLRDGTIVDASSFRSVATANDAVAKLKALGRPAQFGDLQRGVDVVDESVRRGVDVLASEFDLMGRGGDNEWTVLNDECVGVFGEVREKLCAALFPGLEAGALTLRLYKLHMCERGGHFKEHVDTPHDTIRNVATLVLQLPSSVKGGELVVSHEGRDAETCADFRHVEWAAFFSGCKHRVIEVTSGVRVAVSVQVLVDADKQAAAKDGRRRDEAAAEEAFVAELSHALEREGCVGFFCSHDTLAAASAQILRGGDALIRDAIARACPAWTVRALPVLVDWRVCLPERDYGGERLIVERAGCT
jgi:hypothetical protein